MTSPVQLERVALARTEVGQTTVSPATAYVLAGWFPGNDLGRAAGTIRLRLVGLCLLFIHPCARMNK